LSCNTPPPNGCYDPVGGCLNGTCIYTAKQRNTPCTDGDACTTGDLCDASGTCLPGADIRDDGNPCTIDACNKTTGVVTHANTPDGANCDDGNLCNGVETCQARHLARPDADDGALNLRTANRPPATIEAALPNEHPSAYYGYAARLFREGKKDEAFSGSMLGSYDTAFI